MTTTPPPLPEPAAPAPAPRSELTLSAPRWGIDLPIPPDCTLHPTGGLTTTDLRTALVTAVKTGTVLELNPHPDLELDEGTYYLQPPGTTLEDDPTSSAGKSAVANETDPAAEAGQGNIEQNTPANSIAGWTPTNHPTIPAHWIRTILQGHTPPAPPILPMPTNTDTDCSPKEPVPLGRTDPRGLQITGAQIGGRLDLDHLSTTIPLGIHHSHLPHGITAQHGHLTTLTLTGSHLINTTGPALTADGLTVDGDLSAGAVFTGAGERGAVRLIVAHIGGQLDLNGATLTNTTGPALTADGLTVDCDLFANAVFIGKSKKGVVRLLGAHIGGQLNLNGATLTNTTGPALTADGLTVDGNQFIDAAFVGAGKLSAVRLVGVHIGGETSLDLRTAKNITDPNARWLLDGFTYAGYPHRSNLQDWLKELREGTPHYTAQPYRHLAEIAHAAGHDADERTILIAQRQDQIDRGGLERGPRAWARFTGVMLGYGHKPARMAWALLIIIVAALTVTLTLSVHGATTTLKPPTTTGAAPITPKDAERYPCTRVQQAGYALDSSLPLIKTPLSGSCTTTPGTTGTWLAAILAGLQLLAWAAATLFIAGYTRIVRRT